MRIFTFPCFIALALAAATTSFAHPAQTTSALVQLSTAPAATHNQQAERAFPNGRRAARLALISADPAFAAIANLRALERVYRQTDRAAQVPALYQDVLKRTDNLTVRNFASFRLARLAGQANDIQGAEARLRAGLEDNLKRL